MAKITDTYILDLCANVKKLEDKFMQSKNNKHQILEEMRLCHSNAIIYYNQNINLVVNNWNQVSRDGKLNISRLNSALDVIHNCIKKCERHVFEDLHSSEKSGKIYVETKGDVISVKGLETEDLIKDSLLKSSDKMNPIISSDGKYSESINTDELCKYLDELAEDTEKTKQVMRDYNITTSDIPNLDSFKLSSDSSNVNLPDISLTESEKQPQKGGNTKCYVVNIWMTTCPASIRFMKSFSDFQNDVKKTGDNVEFHAISYEKGNEQVSRIMKKANIKYFPTVLFFCGDKVHKHEGFASVDKLKELYYNLTN